MTSLFFWTGLALAASPSLASRATASRGVPSAAASVPLQRQQRLAHDGALAPAARDLAEPGTGAAFLGTLERAAARNGLGERGGRQASVSGAASEEAVLREPNHFRNPRIWGPIAWFFLHDITLAQEQEIPAEQQEKLRFFFTEEMANVLPCDECQARTRRVIKSMRPIANDTWSNRTNLIMWFIMFHNHVNFDMEKEVVPAERVLGHFVANFDKAEPVAITFDPSVDSGKDPQDAFPKVWHAGGMHTPEIIRFRMPKVWGPVGWFFLQGLALAQDDGEPAGRKQALVRFYTKSLSFILPCPFCGMHLRGHLEEGRSPLPTSNMTRTELAQWVSGLHNVVNREKKEPSSQFPWNEVVVGFNRQYEAGQPIDAYLGKGPLKTPHGGHPEQGDWSKSSTPRLALGGASAAAAATLAICLASVGAW